MPFRRAYVEELASAQKSGSSPPEGDIIFPFSRALSPRRDLSSPFCRFESCLCGCSVDQPGSETKPALWVKITSPNTHEFRREAAGSLFLHVHRPPPQTTVSRIHRPPPPPSFF